MRKLASLLAAILSFVPTLLLAVTPYAATISFSNTSGTDYGTVPIIVSVNNTYLAANGYISSSGLDVKVMSGNTSLPRMVADNKTLFAVDVPAHSSQSVELQTGQTPTANFDIVTGYGGYITTSDNANISPSNNSSITMAGYFDMTAVGENVSVQDGSIRNYVAGTNNFTSTVALDPYIAKFLVSTSVDADSNNRNIVRDSTGKIWIGYAKTVLDGWSDLYVDYSSDNGSTWHNSLHIDSSSDSINREQDPRLAIDSGNHIVIAYIADNGTNNYLYSRYFSGVVWSADTQLSEGTEGQGIAAYYQFGLAVDGNDDFHVVWNTRYLMGIGILPQEIRYAHKTSYSAAWGDYAWLTTDNVSGGAGWQNPDITADKDNDLHVTWQGNLVFTDNYSIEYRTKPFGGAWAASSNLTSGWFPSIATDNTGELHLAYGAYTSHEIGYLHTVGAAWQAPEYMGESDSDYLTMFLDRAQLPVISFGNHGWGSPIINYSRVGGIWTNTANVTTDNANWPNSAWSYWPQSGGISTNAPEANGYYLTWHDFDTNDLNLSKPGESSVITTATVTSGTHTITPTINGNSFLLYVDGVASDNRSLGGGTVANSSNNFTFMSIATPYLTSISISVNGTQNLLYQPNTMINGTTMPDLSAGGNTGTITWGSLLLTATVSGFFSLASSGQIPSESNDLVPTVAPPAFNSSAVIETELQNDFFYPIINTIATMGSSFGIGNIGLIFSYRMLIFIICLLAFIVTYRFTRHLTLAGIPVIVFLGWGMIKLVIPWYGFVAIVLLWIGSAVMEGRQAPT